MGGCWPAMLWMCNPLPACCDAPALSKKHKKAELLQGWAVPGSLQMKFPWPCAGDGSCQGWSAGAGTSQCRLHMFHGIYSWKLLRLLCVQGAAGPEC